MYLVGYMFTKEKTHQHLYRKSEKTPMKNTHNRLLVLGVPQPGFLQRKMNGARKRKMKCITWKWKEKVCMSTAGNPFQDVHKRFIFIWSRKD